MTVYSFILLSVHEKITNVCLYTGGFWLISIILYNKKRYNFADEYGGNVGLAITQAMGLTGMFQWGMRQSTELENQMTSVER